MINQRIDAIESLSRYCECMERNLQIAFDAMTEICQILNVKRDEISGNLAALEQHKQPQNDNAKNKN